MKLQFCSWPSCVFVLLTLLNQSATAVERQYYIAAVNIDWDYTTHANIRVGPTYKKAVYREYYAGFNQPKAHPSWSGLLGPTIHGQEGDTIIVIFRNMADHPCSIHPHGIAYSKQSEGSLYFDNTSQFEKEDDVIYPGKEHTYHWEVTSEVSPKADDPSCVTYTYFSHNDIVKDYNTGLIGTLLICKKDSLDDTGKQVYFHQELTVLFGVFDEGNTWYSKEGTSLQNNVKYTINGFTNGSIPDLAVCAYSKVNWHLLGMSSEPELFSVHFNGQVLQQDGHKVSSIGIISGTATSAEMSAIYPGRWLLSSYISKHLEAGMYGFLDVNTCQDFTAPKRKLTIQQRRESQEWIYYIAAEEIIWDYAPNMPENVDGDFWSTYLKPGTERIGQKYKKAVFTQYKDATFKERAEHNQRKNELGILGPVIRAQIRDIIKIVFKNKASRPYSIYPHGLSINKAAEGANYPKEGNQSRAVQPGETYTYVWQVIEEDEPLARDSRCLTRMYHSAVDIPRDIASGLIGPILICKSQSLNTRNVQLRADKEQHAMFAVFDENKSWYLDENINMYCGDPKRVKTDDPEFYKSNIMHTINGYVYESGQVLGFCNGEIATWHVSSVGEQDDIHTVTFYGHTFELNNREEDILSLFPMTGETISINMANIGIWLLASLNTHESKKGLRVKFKDVECFRDVIEEENNYDDYTVGPETFSVWKPIDETEIMKENIKPTKKTNVDIDIDTDAYADVLGLRALRNKGNSIDTVEQLDLSLLDFNDDLLLENNSPSLNDEIKNMTHFRLDFDANNITSTEFQNESTEDALSLMTLNSSSIKSPINLTKSVFTNSRTILRQQDTESKQKQNSERHEDNTTETQTQELSVISTVNVGEDKEGSSDNIFIYSVPASKPLKVQEVEDFVLLDSGEEIKTVSHQHSVEYNYSPATLINNTILKLLDNTTQTVTSQDIQVFNHTSVNSDISYTNNTILNSTQIYSEFTQKDFQELNSSNLEFTLEELKKSKSTQLDSQYTLHGLKELNSTEAGSDFTQHQRFTEYTDLNRSKVDSELTLEKNKQINSTQLNIVVEKKKLKESNNTHVAPESTSIFKESNSSQVQVKFSLKDFQTLNSTHGDSDLIADEFKDVNSTHVNTEFTLSWFKGLNISKTHSILEELKALNSTQYQSNSDIQQSDSKEIQNSKFDSYSTEYIVSNGTKKTKKLLLSSIISITDHAHNETTSPQVNKLHNSTEKFSSKSWQNISLPISVINILSSNGNISQTDIFVKNNRSEEKDILEIPESEESHEEVVIILKNRNHSKIIVSSPLDPQIKNWTYEGKHELVLMELPDHINKYITDNAEAELNRSSGVEEVRKKVILQRVTPVKGYGMKTKKRKEYKPQPRSDISPHGFSPRGFAPSHLTPRTTKPIFNEEDLLAKHIVIGVPRRDFNDYELFAHYQGQNFENIQESTEEYEYVEYTDPYRKQSDITTVDLDEASKYSLKMADSNARVYFITAEEVNWDYAGYGQRREDRSSQIERPTMFKKVLFREYLDSSFTTPHTRGEVDEHLGIMGTVIKAEVDETIYIVFKNLATRSYSLHANGVSYTKNMEGLKYEDGSPYYYKYDNEVQPNQTFTYIWTVNSKVGPLKDESDCRIWTYYSGVNPERDIHSGLIGPLLVCRKGTLSKKLVNTREFMLLFMTFDEKKSWYYEKNYEILKKTNKKAVMDPHFTKNIQFHAINGIIYSLKGLRMYTNQLVNWHLINMGSTKDFHSIHFHGQTFLHKHKNYHRHSVYPLLPGNFATLEMLPSKPGLWLLESEVGVSQQKGMQTLFLVLDNVCNHPLGLYSGTVKDSQITASDFRGSWLPSLARLHNAGKYNAWSTTQSGQWIQVDFQRPVVISKIATQGAKQLLSSHFVLNYTISYSTDRKKWIFYKGDSRTSKKMFDGNRDAHEAKENIFFPPIIGRFVRLYPSYSYNYPTVRMEFYGCELDGCSVPLGIKSGLIEDHQITASSVASTWYSGSWQPWFARLDKQGALNAWQAQSNDRQPWLQIELNKIKKITGIVTQGAKTLGKEMFVTAYILEYSDDGKIWTKYTDDDYELKTFSGNSNNNGHEKNYIYPPIFSRFIRIIPNRWQNSVTMRIELLGCDFE